jgi:integrase
LNNRLLPWCRRKGFTLLKQLNVDALREYRATWPDGPVSAYKNLERLRCFLAFCHQAGWIPQNPAKALKPPRLPEKSSKVKVFADEEIEKILAACDSYPRRNSWGEDNRARIRVYVPLPSAAANALKAIENGTSYFFWSGNGLRKSSVADWQRAIRRLFEIAEVVGHPHMFRHTFATDLLAKGIPMEDVSILLGHKSIRITEAYYSHWVKARRDRLEERVRELWKPAASPAGTQKEDTRQDSLEGR